MKTIYFIFSVLLFAALGGQAQLTLTKSANEPVSGDVHTMVSHDSTTAVPRTTGTGQHWIFTSLAANSNTEVITYTTTASVPQSSLFPGATLASMRGSNSREFFMSSGSDWFFLGEYKTSTGEMFVLNNSALFMSWPVSVSSTFSDVAAGTEVSGSSSTAVTGTLNYAATGAGTVTLPGGSVHNNCLQITSTLVVVTGTGSSATTMTQISYRYYSSSRKLPIADIQYSTESGGSGTSKDFSSYFDLSPLSTGVKEISGSDLFALYPNPSSDIVFFDMPDQLDQAKIEIRDWQGRVIMTTNLSRSLNVSALPEGIYCITVQGNEASLTKRLVINR
jgi:hypothetical protein